MSGGPLVKRNKGRLVPSREEVIRDAIVWFSREYGLQLAAKVFEGIDTAELWKKLRADKAKRAKQSGGSGGLVLLALAVLALSTKGRRQ
jgi:hypothetical protein